MSRHHAGSGLIVPFTYIKLFDDARRSPEAIDGAFVARVPAS
jgi:hypothetical protein